MSEELVTIKTYTYDHETLLVEPQLQAAGIYYILKDHQTATVDPFLSNAIGGIKLRVRKEDIDKALAVINEIEKNQQLSEGEQFKVIDGKDFEKTFEECPECGSEEIFEEKLPMWTSFLKMFSKRLHYCLNCKHEWKQFSNK